MSTHRKSAAILRKFLARKRKANPRLSLRACARMLGVSPSFLSGALAGEKRFAYEKLDRVAQELDMDDEALAELKRAYFPAELVEKKARQSKPRAEAYYQAPSGEFEIIRAWYYLAILDLTTCSDFGGTADEIAVRLGLDRRVAHMATDELIRAGYLERKNDRLAKTEERIRFSSAKSHPSVRSFHLQMLNKAKAALESGMDEQSFERREVSGITLSVDVSKLPLAKKILTDALHEVAELLNEGKTTEVYHLAVQLFPLTKR